LTSLAPLSSCFLVGRQSFYPGADSNATQIQLPA
jgi:hypothetical protein